LIKKVNFRREVLVIAAILNDMLHFALSIPIIVVFIFFYGLRPAWIWIIGIPMLIVIQFIITFGFSIAVSAVNLFFRDIERLVFIFTTLMFYVTPIIYSEDMVPSGYKTLIVLNPLSLLMVGWRNLFMYGTLDFKGTALAFVYSSIIAVAGYYIFRRLKWRFAEVL